MLYVHQSGAKGLSVGATRKTPDEILKTTPVILLLPHIQEGPRFGICRLSTAATWP
jgi:hypothetical protein